MERRGYFFVDQIAFGENKVKLNFIPDGKTKRMSAISHKLDAKEQAKGKGEGDAFANKSEAKKAGKGGAPPEEGKELSKNQLKKLANKEKKNQKKQPDGATEEKKDD